MFLPVPTVTIYVMLMPDCVSSIEEPTLKDDDDKQYAVTTQKPIHT